MTDLAPPTIIGPISACETSVWLDNVVVLPGVIVQVSVNGTPRGAPLPATSTTMMVSVGALTAGDVVSGKQYGGGYGGNPSPPSAQVTVAPSAAQQIEINPPVLALDLFRCAMCARFTNVFPGGVVFVRDANNNLLGAAAGIGGTAIVNFGSPALAEPLTATQVACGFAASTKLPALVAPPPEPLPAATLKGPVLRCQPTAYMSGVLPGATVELQILQTGGPYKASTCATSTAGWIEGFPPLQAGDIVQVIQTLGDCARLGTWSNALFVNDGPAPTPQLVPSVCQTEELLHITNLFDKAFVDIDYGGPQTLLGQASGGTYDVPLPTNTLTSATQVRARQRLSYDPGCDWGDWSIPALVQPDQASPPSGQPVIAAPIYQCGTVVRVTGAVPGGWVGVRDIAGSGWDVSALLYANSDVVDVHIAAGLIVGHTYEPFEIVCGTRTYGPPITADALPSFRTFKLSFTPIVVDPIFDCGSIHVTNLIPGTTVDLFCNIGDGFGLKFNGSFPSPVAELSLDRPAGLVAAAARQRMCAMDSNLSNVATVTAGTIRCAPGGVTTVCALTRGALPDVGGGDELLIGTDLGIPIDHGGQLYLLFGDAFPTGQTPASVVKPIFRVAGGPECPVLDPLPQNLAVAHPCSDLASYENGSGDWIESLLVDNLPLDEAFEVPSGGFSYDGRMYAFVTKRLTGQNVPGLVALKLPGDVMLQSFLVSRVAQCEFFQLEYAGKPVDQLSDPDGINLRFINIAARVYHNSGELGPDLPIGDILLLWGTGLYHLSQVFFAWTSLTSGHPIPDPSTWHYLTGESPTKFSVGLKLPDDATLLAPLTLPIPPNMDSVADGGEIGVTWVPGLNRWLMFVTSLAAISFAFIAPNPWGPWTAVQIFDSNTDLQFDLAGDGHTIILNSLPQSGLPFGTKWYGYGNYVIERFTKWNPDTSTATIYYVASINSDHTISNGIGPDNYYGTFLVKAELRCGP